MNKLSDLFRKRALLGVGVFCVAAIVTVGALSIGGNDSEENPDQLVDLNEQNPAGDDPQVADGTENPGEGDNPQVADKPENPGEGDTPQVADKPENPKEGDASQVADKPENPKEEDKPQVADKPENPKETDNQQQVADNTGKEDDTQGTEVLSPQVIAERLTYNKADGLAWPLQGEILIPYSPDHGVYYETLDQFATSNAVIIASEVGMEVCAAAKGVVVSIEEDVRTGQTVTLALGNNTQLVYGQLMPGEIKVGDVLEAGECLGTVAEPTRYYVMEGANLYFQVLENGQSIDPTELLK